MASSAFAAISTAWETERASVSFPAADCPAASLSAMAFAKSINEPEEVPVKFQPSTISPLSFYMKHRLIK